MSDDECILVLRGRSSSCDDMVVPSYQTGVSNRDVFRLGLSEVRIAIFHLSSFGWRSAWSEGCENWLQFLTAAIAAQVDFITGDGNLFAQRNFKDDRHTDYKSSILIDLLERLLGEINPHRSGMNQITYNLCSSIQAGAYIRAMRGENVTNADCMILISLSYGKQSQISLSRSASDKATADGVFSSGYSDEVMLQDVERVKYLQNIDFGLKDSDQAAHSPLVVIAKLWCQRNLRVRSEQSDQRRRGRGRRQPQYWQRRDDEEEEVEVEEEEDENDPVGRLRSTTPSSGGEEVNCSNAIQVILEINPHELKKVEDQSEQFELVFIMKMYWQDPKLHSFWTKVVLRKTPAEGKVPPAADPGHADGKDGSSKDSEGKAQPAAESSHADGKDGSSKDSRQAFEAPLQEVEGVVRRKYLNGDLLFIEKDGKDEDGRFKPARILKKEEYAYLKELEFPPDETNPEWDHYFFPSYTFINFVSFEGNEEPGKTRLVWCNEDQGGFVEFSKRYDATFQETLELKRFPIDKQILQIKLTAEADIQEFQFVLLDQNGKCPEVSGEEWFVEKHMQEKCTTYIRYADEKCPYYMQRSLAKTVLHIQRKSDYYFHNVMINIFLVNVIALFAFSVPIGDVGDRLGLLSGTLVAVTAYQSVINSVIPRKPHLTQCDKYVIFAVVFQVALGCETMVLAFCTQFLEANLETQEEVDDLATRIANIDRIAGACFAGIWVISNATVLTFFNYMYENWKAVYDSNKEPFAPMQECITCRGRWLCKQATHQENKTKEWRCPFCNENRKGRFRQHYYTPGCKGFDKPLVPRLDRKEFVKMQRPESMKQGEPKHAEEFNERYSSEPLLE
eukprot:s1014_g11.t1